jgi:hypothetical protein
MIKINYLIKAFLIAYLIISLNANINGQSIYYDAIVLSDKSNLAIDGTLKPNDKVYSILAKYSTKHNPSNSDMDVEFDGSPGKNPFLIISSGPHAVESFQSIQNSFSSIGGLNVTTFADGLAKFLVNRTKEELNVTFFIDFKNVISDPRYVDLQTIFPETYQLLLLINDEIYNYEIYIRSLRESFKHDLDNLSLNLPTILDNHPGFFNEHPELAALLNSGCYIAEQLKNKVHPGDILEKYPVEYLDKLNINWKGSVQTLQIFSASLRDSSKSDSVYWVSPQQIKKLVSDSSTFKIYLGLIYQVASTPRYNGVKFTNNSLVGILKRFASKYDSIYPIYKNYIVSFGEKANKLNMLIKNYKKPTNDSLALEQFYNYVNASNDLLEHCTKVDKLLGLKGFSESVKEYFDVIRSSNDLMINVNRKNYPLAIINAATVYKIIISKYHDESNDKVISTEEKNFLKHSDVTFTFILKYGTFMANIVQSKSSDDIEKAIEAAALPVGSSAIKSVSLWNVSLNAYTGISYGKQLIHDNQNKFFGVNAPVGIAISHRTGWKPIGAISLYISIIDIGALVSYRFTNSKDTLKPLPEINLQNIFAPGAQIVFGRIFNSPLSINAGVQFGPAIRKVSTTNVTVEEPIWRFNMGITVDIPLLNLYTKPRD